MSRGWFGPAAGVLAATAGLNAIARGSAESYAVFLVAIEAELDASRAELASVYSVGMALGGLAAPLAGLAHDRFGPRLAYGAGLFILAAAFLAASASGSVAMLQASLGAAGGVGAAAIGMVAAAGLIPRWYDRRLATATAVAYAGVGVGVILFAPLSQWLIDLQGWRAAYRSLGLALLAATPLVMMAPWRVWAAGAPEVMAARAAAATGAGDAKSVWDLRRALGDGAFWALFGVFFFTAVAIFSVTLQMPAYLISLGFDPLEAASAFGVTASLTIGGIIATGALADVVGRRAAATVSFSLTLVGIAAFYGLSYGPSWSLLGLGVVCFGLSQGARGPIVSTLTARLFPGGAIGAIYGATSMGVGLGAALGSWLAGLLYDWTGGYGATFALGAANAVIGLSLFWCVPALRTGRRRGEGPLDPIPAD